MGPGAVCTGGGRAYAARYKKVYAHAYYYSISSSIANKTALKKTGPRGFLQIEQKSKVYRLLEARSMRLLHPAAALIWNQLMRSGHGEATSSVHALRHAALIPRSLLLLLLAHQPAAAAAVATDVTDIVRRQLQGTRKGRVAHATTFGGDCPCAPPRVELLLLLHQQVLLLHGSGHRRRQGSRVRCPPPTEGASSWDGHGLQEPQHLVQRAGSRGPGFAAVAERLDLGFRQEREHGLDEAVQSQTMHGDGAKAHLASREEVRELSPL